MSTFRQLLPSGEVECVDRERNCNVKDYPGGVYSALRTIDQGRKLGEIDKHIQRLLSSSREKFGPDFDDEVQGSLAGNFLSFIRHIAENSPSGDKDRRYTMVIDRLGGASNSFQMLCSYTDINPPPPAVQAEVQFLRRLNPQVKSVDWAIQREQAERIKKESSNEVILADEDRLYEGLSSNFAVLDKDNRIITAPNTDVLCGTIMEVVKMVASEMGFTVVEEFPSVQALDNYQAAFITSTSRLLLPLQSLSLPGGKEITFCYNPLDETAPLNLMRRSVEQRLIERADDIKMSSEKVG